MELADLAARLDAVESRQRIAEVLYTYARAWDRRDVEAVGTCFWPEAYIRQGAYDGPASEFVAFGLARTAAVKAARHLITNVLVELAGDRALSECHFSAVHRRPNADGTDEEDYFIGGRLIDLFERRQGEWRILRRRGLNEFERLERRADLTLASAPLGALGGRKPDDPLYALLTEFREGRS